MAEKIMLSFVVDNTGAIKQVDKFSDELEKSEKQADDTGKSVKKMGASIKAGTVAAAAAVAGFVLAVKKMTDAMAVNVRMAADQEQVVVSLASSMARAGASYLEQAESLQAMAAEIQATTKYGDTDTLAVLSTLTTYANDYDAALVALSGTLDAASATGKEMNMVMEAVGKALSGNAGSLGEMGMVLTETQTKWFKTASVMERAEKVAELLGEKYGGAAQAELAGYNAQIQMLGNYWGDAREAMGQAVLTFIEVQGGAAGAQGTMESLVGWVQEVSGAFLWFAKLGWVDLFAAQLLRAEKLWLWFVKQILTQLRVLVREWARVPFFGAGGLDDLAAGLDGALAEISGRMEDLTEDIITLTDDAVVPADDALNLYNKNLALGASESVIMAAETKTLAADVGEAGRAFELSASSAAIVADATKRFGDQSVYAQLAAIGLTYELTELEHEASDGGPMINALTASVNHFGEALENIPGLAAIMRSSMEGLFHDIFTGDFDSILGSFEDLFGQITEMAATNLTDQLMAGLNGGGFDLGNMAATAGLGIGAGLMTNGAQSGNYAQGILGGAMAGASIGFLLAPATAGISIAIGAAIGAVVGGITTWLASSNPGNSFIRPDGSGGFEVGTRGKENNLSAEQRATFERQLEELYDTTAMAWRDTLLTFGDVDLFDLVRDTQGGLDTGWLGLDAASVVQYFSDSVLPDHFKLRFKNALGRGLRNLGVAQGTIDEFWGAWENLGAEAGLEALQDFIRALVQSADLLAAGDWEQIQAEIGKTPLERWSEFITDAAGQIELLRTGWDQMSLPDRASEMLRINEVYQQSLQATIQLMTQLDQMRQSINQGWDQMTEDINLGSMTEGQQATYFQEQIERLMAELAMATDPNAIGELNAELQRYISSLRGVTDGGEWANWGETWDDVLLRMIADAQALVNDRIDIAEANVQEQWEGLTADLQAARDALAGFDEALKGYSDGTTPLEVQFDPTINVQVTNTASVPIETIVTAIIDDYLGNEPAIQ